MNEPNEDRIDKKILCRLAKYKQKLSHEASAVQIYLQLNVWSVAKKY